MVEISLEGSIAVLEVRSARMPRLPERWLELPLRGIHGARDRAIA